MIFRLSAKLGKKLKVVPTEVLPTHSNPYADWSANLFTADRAQYILITNTVSCYSRVISGRGITDDSTFLNHAISSLSELMVNDGFQLTRDRVFLPETSAVSYSKALNRSVTGSMNELVMYAKILLSEEEISPFDASIKLNGFLLSYVDYVYPRDGFGKMKINQ